MGCIMSFLYVGVIWMVEKEMLVELDLSDKFLKEEMRWIFWSFVKGYVCSIIVMVFKVLNFCLLFGYNIVLYSFIIIKICDCLKLYRNWGKLRSVILFLFRLDNVGVLDNNFVKFYNWFYFFNIFLYLLKIYDCCFRRIILCLNE